MSGTVYLHKVMLKNFDDTSYLADLPVVQNLQRMGELSFESPVTFFVGENGSGKSTYWKLSLFQQDSMRKEVPETFRLRRNRLSQICIHT